MQVFSHSLLLKAPLCQGHTEGLAHFPCKGRALSPEHGGEAYLRPTKTMAAQHWEEELKEVRYEAGHPPCFGHNEGLTKKTPRPDCMKPNPQARPRYLKSAQMGPTPERGEGEPGSLLEASAPPQCPPFPRELRGREDLELLEGAIRVLCEVRHVVRSPVVGAAEALEVHDGGPCERHN